MSSFTHRTGLIIGLIFIALTHHGRADDWFRGSVALTFIEGQLEVGSLGGELYELSPSSVPSYLMGLLSVEAATGGEVFFKTSNHVMIYNHGAGFFAIERFEQQANFEGDWFLSERELGQSRMIFNLRYGTLIVDSRALSESSQLTVETPFGRISVKNALWMIDITKDERKHIYSFDIQCMAGALRLTDHQGSTYKIRTGQRISGVGASSAPSVEIAEITASGFEIFENFKSLAAEVDTISISPQALVAATKRVSSQAAVEPKAARPIPESGENDGRRPLLIEYAPLSAPVTPFRGVTRPPSEYEADLF